MSDKLIRDELLRSHRYVSLSNDTTKLLFLHLTLSSDSLSNAEATTTALGIIMGRSITETAASTLLSELADHDLVRVYQANGKRYVHIPRSRQRIRYLSGKHPRPPPSVEDIEIKKLIDKVGLQSDRGQTQDGPFAPEVEVLLSLKRSADKPSNVKNKATARFDALALTPPNVRPEVWSAWCRHRGAKMTAEAIRLQTIKLGRLHQVGDDPNDIIEQSICNTWTSLRPLERDRQRVKKTAADKRAAVAAGIFNEGDNSAEPNDITGQSKRIA